MSEATFEGATVEAALEAAAAKIGAAVSELDYEVVEKKKDFWGLGDGTVVIKAWRHAPTVQAADEIGGSAAEPQPATVEEQPLDATEEEEAAAEEEPPATSREAVGRPAAALAARQSEPEDAEPPGTPFAAAAAPQAAAETTAKPEGGGEVKTEWSDDAGAAEAVDPGDIRAMLEQIFHDMAFECTAAVEPEEGGFLATIDGADKEALLEGNGRCLSALELLINNAFRHKLPRGNKIRVDAGDFRNKRDEEVSDLAFQVAHSAKESGRTQETQPLNPYERRLVHLALADDPAVTTRSRGSGFLKNVQIIPSAGGGDRTRGRRG